MIEGTAPRDEIEGSRPQRSGMRVHYRLALKVFVCDVASPVTCDNGVSFLLTGHRGQKFLERRFARKLGFVPRLETVLAEFDAERPGSPINAPSPSRSRTAASDNNNKIVQGMRASAVIGE